MIIIHQMLRWFDAYNVFICDMILYRLPRDDDLNAVKPVSRNWIVTLSAVVAFSLAMFAAVFLLYGDISFVRTSLRATPDVPNNASAWGAFLQITPVPYTIPLPESISKVIDGNYAKIDPSPPQWGTCRRCADYRLSGGIWRLQFDKGVMCNLYDVTGWHSLVSFTVSGDQMHIFNDTYGPGDVGLYRWQQMDGALGLQVIEDACAFRLRGENISKQVCSACPPSNGSAIGSCGKEMLPSCALPPALPEADATYDSALKVSVYSGDGRFFEKPPNLFALANRAKAASPEGIQVTCSQKSASFGLNRVLWWVGEWIEASMDLPFSSMGVQFLGESQMGWARLLFDGEVIWQGDVAGIGLEKDRQGGFVEVSGFTLGRHTIRVESMRFDYRPVTVASFGFSYQDGVEAAAH